MTLIWANKWSGKQIRARFMLWHNYSLKFLIKWILFEICSRKKNKNFRLLKAKVHFWSLMDREKGAFSIWEQRLLDRSRGSDMACKPFLLPFVPSPTALDTTFLLSSSTPPPHSRNSRFATAFSLVHAKRPRAGEQGRLLSSILDLRID